MKKYLERIFPIMLVFILLFIIAACSSANENSEIKPISSDLSDEELLYLLNEYDFDLSVLSDDENQALSIVRTLINTIETDPDYSFQFSGFVHVSGFANRLKLYVATE